VFFDCDRQSHLPVGSRTCHAGVSKMRLQSRSAQAPKIPPLPRASFGGAMRDCEALDSTPSGNDWVREHSELRAPNLRHRTPWAIQHRNPMGVCGDLVSGANRQAVNKLPSLVPRFDRADIQADQPLGLPSPVSCHVPVTPSPPCWVIAGYLPVSVRSWQGRRASIAA